jgi:hypothetical protein
MARNHMVVSASGAMLTFIVLLNGIILKAAYLHDSRYYYALLVTIPLLILAFVPRKKPDR